jgi:hypothetical protein
MQKNKDLPASPVHPVQDQFGQIIMMTGFSKMEMAALEILKAMIVNDFEDNPESIDYCVKQSFKISEKFCAYLEDQQEDKATIIQSV